MSPVKLFFCVILLIRSGSQDRLFHFFGNIAAVGKSGSRHASAQCCRQHQNTDLILKMHNNSRSTQFLTFT